MSSQRVTVNNANQGFRTPDDTVLVRGKFYNELKADFDALVASLVDVVSDSPNVIQKTVEVELTAEQIVGTAAGDIGHASGAILVPSPGSDYTLELVSAVLFYDYSAAAYTGGGDDNVVQLGTVAQTGVIAGADLLEAAGDKITMVAPLSAADLPMTVGTTLNFQGTALTQPGAYEISALQLTVAEDTGGTATLTLNGVAHVITLTADTVEVNAAEIKAYIDANVTTHTATVLTDTVTITAVVAGNQTNTTYLKTTANSTVGVVGVTPGATFAEGVLRAHVTYRQHTTQF